MAAQSEDLQRALEIISQTPNSILQEHRQSFVAILHRLEAHKRTRVSSLVTNLDGSRPKVEEYLNKTYKQAVARHIDWQNTDIRVHDIRLGATKHNLLTKFRKGLGERSLALQFHNWELQHFQTSRLSVLAADQHTCKEHTEGRIPQFLNTHDLPKLSCVTKGIQHGTKILIFERVMETMGISAILFFCFSQFRAIPYLDLQTLKAEIERSVWIGTLAKSISTWFQQCILDYEG